MCNRHIIHPKSNHDELPLDRRKKKINAQFCGTSPCITFFIQFSNMFHQVPSVRVILGTRFIRTVDQWNNPLTIHLGEK